MKMLRINTWEKVPENFTGIAEYPSGLKEWFKNGKRHREDDPAIEYSDGSKEWFKNGKRHREGGPAFEYKDGTKIWYLEGKSYGQINLKDYVVLDYSEGKFGIMWYKLLGKDKIFEHPDIPGLIIKK